MSKARRMSSVINKDNQNHWIQLTKTSSKQQLEREVAAASPKASVRDQLNYVHPSQEVKDQVRIKKLISSKSPTPQVRVQLTVGVSEQLMLKIRRKMK